ncbi:MAG: YkgJ family cysteine cluster protein [Myxococcota bacterium]
MDAPELRHSCYRCGGSCQGPGAAVSAAEQPGIAERAALLGVSEPVVDGRLRTVNERCVFLQQDNLCALHLTFGAEAKPASCRAFPHVHLDGRTGLDPGCLAGFLSENPPFANPLPEVLQGTLELSLGRLVGGASAPGRPPPRIAAWIERDLDDVLDALLRPSTAPGLRARLRHLAVLKSTEPPRWVGLSEASQSHALDVARRMVGLQRVGRDPERVALDTLRGAALCAWADGALHRFAPALAAWTRLQRSGPLLDVLDRPLPPTDRG